MSLNPNGSSHKKIEAAGNQAPEIRHLYVHIPFCTHICPYCSFYKTRNTLPDMKAFLPALKREIEWARSEFDLRPETVFFGGGTPSALSIGQLEDLFEAWPWKHAVEFTMEANPLTISPAKAQLLKSAGINRVSLGAQAFDEPSLKILGRTHRAEDIRKSVQILRETGFENINLDLMFALPGQTLEQWLASVRSALELEPEHISAYNLNYEEDTEFFEKLQAGVLRIDEGREREFFHRGMDLLEAGGFEHYEISNLAKPGHASLHNRAYWNGSDYIGLGPSACSTVGLLRWQNVPDTRLYSKALLESGEPQRKFEELSLATKRAERILLGLRVREGVPAEELGAQKELLTNLAEAGLIEVLCGRVALTREGRLVADSVTELFI
ncbi:MAG: radical SAM family heme chaperone HemW [Methylacidiphilales bacterium]|nr:radical SAM family heme chaperone HemW [Candidatus Methylacidiphilales bacterium]